MGTALSEPVPGQDGDSGARASTRPLVEPRAQMRRQVHDAVSGWCVDAESLLHSAFVFKPPLRGMESTCVAWVRFGLGSMTDSGRQLQRFGIQKALINL